MKHNEMKNGKFAIMNRGRGGPYITFLQFIQLPCSGCFEWMADKLDSVFLPYKYCRENTYGYQELMNDHLKYIQVDLLRAIAN